MRHAVVTGYPLSRALWNKEYFLKANGLLRQSKE
jgi:hypothetical protein